MCDTYIQAFKNNGDISFAGMREVAVNDLKLTIHASERDSLYDELKRGIGILDDDAHLNMYLWSFGKMHMAKWKKLVPIFRRCLMLHQKILKYSTGAVGKELLQYVCLTTYITATFAIE